MKITTKERIFDIVTYLSFFATFIFFLVGMIDLEDENAALKAMLKSQTRFQYEGMTRRCYELPNIKE